MVFLTITGGKIIPKIAMPVSSTILEVKEKLKKVTNVDVGRQTLMFNNEVLMNDKTIADYDIKLSAEIVLEVTPFPGEPEFHILVKYRNQKAQVKVKETTLVAELRAKIGRIWNIPNKNAITLDLGCTVMEDDDTAVSAYYLCKGSHLEVKVTEPSN